MKIFAISDLHLSFHADKPMDVFGPHWHDHPARLKKSWVKLVGINDVVLIPGDISWSMKLSDAAADLEFIHSLPGIKVIMKGNHDYWWSSFTKVRQVLPASVRAIQNTSIMFGTIGIAGSRLWIDPELRLEASTEEDQKLFQRELGRFAMSLKLLGEDAHVRIIMTHFPPISQDGRTGKAVELARESGCSHWIFGHMHLGTNDYTGFNRIIGTTQFHFVSADYLDFSPKLIYDTDNP